jgi:hypothetical protein
VHALEVGEGWRPRPLPVQDSREIKSYPAPGDPPFRQLRKVWYRFAERTQACLDGQPGELLPYGNAILSDNDFRMLLQLCTQEIHTKAELLAARLATAKHSRWQRCMDAGIFARDHASLGASDEDRWFASKVDLLGQIAIPVVLLCVPVQGLGVFEGIYRWLRKKFRAPT